MQVTSLLAKHFREVYFGKNWTWSNLKDNLIDVTWDQAITPVNGFNTIAALVYHTGYFSALLDVLNGKPLTSKDEFSFSHPPITSQKDWEQLLNETFINAELAATMIEQLPEYMLWESFTDEKYGNYYRNIQGIIEHTHYHLGQIVFIKKMIIQQNQNDKEYT